MIMAGGPNTTVRIGGERFFINGRPTYEGRPDVEGLLYNIRTVNATFDDTLGHVDYFDDDGSHAENDHAGYGQWRSPDSAFANTQRYVDALPQYRDCGILAVNLNFQGGHPLHGKTWITQTQGSANRGRNAQRDVLQNSAFGSDGVIDPRYAKRIAAVIDACAGLGMAVFLQYFHFGQDTVFTDEQGVLAAADHATDWICRHGWRNVIVEIANEVMAGHYHHAILQPSRVHELIERVRQRGRDMHGTDLLVSTSEAALLHGRNWRPDEIDRVFSISDVVLLHGGDGIDHGDVGDQTEVARKIDYIRSRPWFRARPRPIVFNESDGKLAFEAALGRRVSFGLHSDVLQTMWPPKWGVWSNRTMWFYNRVRELAMG